MKNGIDATGDVHLGVPTPADGGRSSVQVTVHNTADSAKSFAVQVNFRDGDGNLLDATVVTVGDVGSGKDGTATARSNRKLSGTIRAEVGRAVRY
ncbi:hypothetical protein GCM10022403_047250 [Streptomyces coacervatus]|uniref:CARDB domain-containing protein n=1 Tax=Streptomyces coacervatus TaxID=647381 RepID=A0ABP7I381_9ACTN